MVKPEKKILTANVEYDESGFVKKYVCPVCEGQLTFSHKDDVGAKFFECQKCGKRSSRLRSKKREELDVYLEGMAREVSFEEISDILNITVREDETEKMIVFLTLLLTYTDGEQQNILMTGESAIGKTYIPREVASLFPKEDVMTFGSASPTSFFHSPKAVWVDQETFQPIDFGLKPDKDSSQEEWEWWRDIMKNSLLLLDLSRKIVIFWDQPNYHLLEKLRSVLSHDEKVIKYQITDRQERKGLRTKNVAIKGFFTCVFCTAKVTLNEQEQTRTFMLSPKATKRKIEEGLNLIDEKNVNPLFKEWVENHSKRMWLKDRIDTCQMENINKIIFDNEALSKMREWYNQNKNFIQPRDMRDYPRLLGLAKAWALLNHEQRKIETNGGEKILHCNETDVNVAIKLYMAIAEPNQRGLSPEVFHMFQDLFNEAQALTLRELEHKYFNFYRRPLNHKRFREEILPAWESAGLLRVDQNPSDKREKLYIKTKYIPQVGGETVLGENITYIGGVDKLEDYFTTPPTEGIYFYKNGKLNLHIVKDTMLNLIQKLDGENGGDGADKTEVIKEFMDYGVKTGDIQKLLHSLKEKDRLIYEPVLGKYKVTHNLT